MAGLASYALRMPICAQCGTENPEVAKFCTGSRTSQVPTLENLQDAPSAARGMKQKA